MYLIRQVSCLRIIFDMKISRIKESKIDYGMNLFSSFMYLVLNLLFWVLLDGIGFSVEGWKREDIFVFLAFSELFFGLDSALFSISSRFWYVIYSGMLDVFLTKPQDPRTRFMLLNTDFVGILMAFISCFVLLGVSGKEIKIFNILLGIIIVIISSIILANIRSILSYTAFWQGKMDAICEFSDALTWFNKYPLTIMPGIVRVIISIVVPFFFFSTFPAQLVNGMLTTKEQLKSMLLLLICLLIWKCIDSCVWKKGLGRYESING